MAGGFVLAPKWCRALNAHRYAEHIRRNSRNQDGTYSAFEDEITTGTEAQSRPSDPRLTISPMRFLAWDSAEREAKALRPIRETVFWTTLPLVVYVMALALGWIARGFGT